MTTYDTWVLIMLAPAVWWVLGMVRAVIAVRARAADVEWDSE